MQSIFFTQPTLSSFRPPKAVWAILKTLELYLLLFFIREIYFINKPQRKEKCKEF